MQRSDPLVESIARACEGLVVTSETDSDVSPVVFRSPRGLAIGCEVVLALVGQDPATRCDEVSLREFFEPRGRRRDWHDRQDAEMAQGFRRLERVLRRRLDEPRVFRIGDRSIDVLVLGRARDGRVVGIRTSIVET
ncbi:MAG: nuclease A inhibitor family protein [Blastocatellia bacterium]